MNEGLSLGLTPDDRQFLESVVRLRKAAGLVVRRANALLLLDDGYRAGFAKDIAFTI